MKIRRTIGLAVVAIGVSGCVPVEMLANDVGIPSPSTVVADKAPPDTLIAADGSTCKVPEARFENIRTGRSITCVSAAGSTFILTNPRS